MASGGHAANMKVMSAVYHDRNKEALQQAHGGGSLNNTRPKAAAESSSGGYFELTHT